MIQIGNTVKVRDWIDTHRDEPERCEQLLRWVEMVCREPEVMITGTVRNETNRRSFHFSDIPVASTRVTFRIVEYPLRAIYLLDIDDGLFRSS